MGSVTGQLHVMRFCTWRVWCLIREHIDSISLFARFLAPKSRGICTDGHSHTWEHVQGALAPKCAWDTHQLHVRYAWNMGYSSTPQQISNWSTLNVWTTHIRYTSTTHQMHKSKHTSTMHQTSIYIQHTNQNMSNTQKMRIRFLFDPHEPKLTFFFSAAISALASTTLP